MGAPPSKGTPADKRLKENNDKKPGFVPGKKGVNPFPPKSGKPSTTVSGPKKVDFSKFKKN